MELKKSTLLIATIGSFLTPFMGSSINIALPSIGEEFSMNAIVLSWVPTLYLLAAAVFLVPFGRIADIYGRKKVFTYGILTYTLSSLLLALSPSPFFLLSFRVLQGMGGAMIFGTAVAILTSVYPPGERGKVIGINVAAIYCGLSLGPFLGGFLTQTFGWRSIFSVNVPLGLFIFALVATSLKGEWTGAQGEKFDIHGSIFYGVALITAMYGVSLLPSTAAVWLIGAGGLITLLFIVWETRVSAPVLNLNLFKSNTVFTFSNMAALINYAATSAVAFLMSLYLQYIRGLTPQEAGIILLCQPVIMVIFSPIAGRLSDTIEPRVVASLGMALTAAALVTFTFLGDATSVPLIIGRLALLGTGLAFFSSPNTNAIMGSVEKKFYGVASAMVGTMRLIGQMTSMGVAMLVVALYVGKVEITPAYYGLFLTSARVTFTIFVGLCILGIFASLARGNVRKN